MISLKDNNSLVRKVGFLFILVILLQIPMFFINRIIDEREYSYRNMVREIGNEWGEKQTIAGAFLIIPYSDVKVEYDEYGKKIERNVVKDWILLPDKLNVKVDLKDEVRKRGIYKTTVYSGDIILEGEFPKLCCAFWQASPPSYPPPFPSESGCSDAASFPPSRGWR